MAVRQGYERSLAWSLDHARTMLVLLLATVALNVYLYIVIPKGFFPQQDTGQLWGGLRGDAALGRCFTDRRQQLVAGDLA